MIGAYFHAHVGNFPSFEAKMRTFLAQGLIVHMRRKLFSKVGVRVLAAFMIVGLVALGVALVQTLLKIITVIAPRSLSTHFERVRT